MTTKTYGIIAISAFGVMVAGSVIAGILKAMGVFTDESLGVQGKKMILSGDLVLFFILGFALVPLMIRAFIVMQVSIGNGELGIVKFIQAKEQTVVYCVWGLFLVGMAIGLPVAIKSWFAEIR